MTRPPRPARSPRWCWCDECDSWVGSTPPLLPLYWSNEKSAGMHRSGTAAVGGRPHTVRMVALADILPAPVEQARKEA